MIEREGRRLIDAVLLRVDDRAVPHVDARGDDRELLRGGVEENPRIAVAVDRVVGEEHDGPVPPLRDAVLVVERDDERIEENDGVASRVSRCERPCSPEAREQRPSGAGAARSGPIAREPRAAGPPR